MGVTPQKKKRGRALHYIFFAFILYCKNAKKDAASIPHAKAFFLKKIRLK